MGFLEELMASAKNVVDTAGQKTDKVVEITKLKYQLSQMNNALRELYEKLGSSVYSMKKSDYQNDDLVDSLVEEIDDLKAQIREINEKIAAHKEVILCKACGTQNDKSAYYCMKCGNKLFEEPDLTVMSVSTEPAEETEE